MRYSVERSLRTIGAVLPNYGTPALRLGAASVSGFSRPAERAERDDPSRTGRRGPTALAASVRHYRGCRRAAFSVKALEANPRSLVGVGRHVSP